MISISGWGRSVLIKGKRPKERTRRECKRTLLTPKSPETYKQERQIKIQKHSITDDILQRLTTHAMQSEFIHIKVMLSQKANALRVSFPVF